MPDLLDDDMDDVGPLTTPPPKMETPPRSAVRDRPLIPRKSIWKYQPDTSEFDKVAEQLAKSTQGGQ